MEINGNFFQVVGFLCATKKKVVGKDMPMKSSASTLGASLFFEVFGVFFKYKNGSHHRYTLISRSCYLFVGSAPNFSLPQIAMFFL